MDRTPVEQLETNSEAHFRLYFFAAIAGLMGQAVEAFDSLAVVIERFPFVSGYANELARSGLEGTEIAEAPRRWREIVASWEKRITERLPLRSLADAADLDYQDIVALAGATLVDEDMRFGALFSAIHGMADEPRPTVGMIMGWADPDQAGYPALIRARRLLELGLLETTNPNAPASAWRVRLPSLVSMVLRGHRPEVLAPGLKYRPPHLLPQLESLVLSESVRDSVARLHTLIARGEVTTVVVRGLRSNGRRSLVSALAKRQEQGILEVDSPQPAIGKALSLVGPLAALLDAVPVFVVDAAAGETAAIPPLTCRTAWRAVVTGPRGGLSGLEGDQAALVKLDLPDLSMRRTLWLRAAAALDGRQADEIAERFRMTSGAILRLARNAMTQAKLAGRDSPDSRDLARARETLDRGELDVFAIRTACSGDWSALVASEHTWSELRVLEQRCRHRERLNALAGATTAGRAACGARALFKGPSGTGKTLAARLLAAALGMDGHLFRVDLSSVVNKYIGETEKHLNLLFDRAEEIDAILLFDEGDALFGRRTSVQTSTDRYANLQTNFLLQRLESHGGIVLITTNLGDANAIDSAFQRRMDIVVEFGLPDAPQRLAIWQLHLPPNHQVPAGFLDEVAYRCALSGGQIRNAASHAALLAFSDGEPIGLDHTMAAVQREYRKARAVCPLRTPAAVV